MAGVLKTRKAGDRSVSHSFGRISRCGTGHKLFVTFWNLLFYKDT